VFPKELVKPCILAGCPPGKTVLDPFGGTGTVGQVADELGRNAVLIELNPVYVAMQTGRNSIVQVVNPSGVNSPAEQDRGSGWLF